MLKAFLLLLGVILVGEAKALVITEEFTVLDGTNPDGSALVLIGQIGFTNVSAGIQGSYQIVNDTAFDILGFAVSSNTSELAFHANGLGNWASFDMDAQEWGSMRIMSQSLIGVALSQAGIATDGTPEGVFGEFASIFGTDSKANFYFADGSGGQILPGTTVLPGSFMFSPAQFASSYVAFGVTSGLLGNGAITADDIHMLTGSVGAAGGDDGTNPDPSDDPVAVAEPEVSSLLIFSLGVTMLLRRKTARR